MRLQRWLSAAGVTSRRKAEDLIAQGRVTVNGRTATLGTKVEAGDDVRLDGRPVAPRPAAYYLFYKPRGVVATLADPRGRRDLRPFLAGLPERVFPVGRLDRDSEGLLLLTNDGALAERLTHPRHHVPKTYAVTVRGHPSAQALAAMAEGLRRPELTTRPAGVRLEAVLEDRTRLTVTLWEGQRRQIRRMFEAFGHEVLRLKRVAIGPLADPALRPGEVRPLRREEVAALLGAALAEAPRHPESPGGRRAPSGAAGRRATRRPAPVPRRRREVGREDGGRQRR